MYEKLLIEADALGIEVIEKKMRGRNKGFYGDNIIWIDKKMNCVEKACTMAEELGHYYTSTSDITNLKDFLSYKQEKRARNWGFVKVCPLESLVVAFLKNLRTKDEISDFLGITENDLEEAIKHYKAKYGMFATVGKYTLWFEPRLVLQIPFDEESGSFK